MNVRSLILGAFALAAALPALLQAQSEPKTPFIHFTYLKVEPDKMNAYIERMRDYHQPINAERAKQGFISSTKTYRVVWPNGDSQAYNLVRVTEYPTLGHIDRRTPAGFSQQVVGAEKYAKNQSSPIAVKTVRSQYAAVRAATADWSKANNRIMVMHYIKALPGKAQSFINLQRAFYLPLAEDSIKSKTATSWAATSLYFAGPDYPYSHISMNGYESLSQMDRNNPPEISKKWDEKSKAANAELPNLRQRVNGELWQLIEGTAVPALAPASR
jgi:hypothetical protein